MGGWGRRGDLYSFVLGKGRGRREEVGRARRARVGSCRGGEVRRWGGVEGHRFRRRWGGVSLCEDEQSPPWGRGEAPAELGSQCGLPHPVRSRAGAFPPPPQPGAASSAEKGPGRERSATPGSPALGDSMATRHAPCFAFLTPWLCLRVRPDHCPRLPHPWPHCSVLGREGGKSGLTFFFSKTHYLG